VPLTQRPRPARGFSLIELLVTIGVIVILILLLMPVVSNMQARAQRSQCMANLKTLAVGANLYIQQNGSWPQMDAATAGGTDEEIANWWVAKLEPFTVPRKSWICPTIQNLLGNPDFTQPQNARIDYFTTVFDDKPTTPHEWPRQPWFIERGDVHGNGPLIIFTDGSISDLNTAKSTMSGQ
jgi:prepilin-type N-terminal cleavage/methylation domain-containing protein